jgi:thymidylate kinase
MITRRRLVQSREDVVMAGMVGMLAFSDRQDASGWQWRGNPAAVTEILRLNAMPLAYLRGKGGPVLSPLLESVEFTAELGKHQKKYDQWKEAFGAVKDAFLSNGVKYLFIKSPSLFPYTSGNLDVMVKEQDFGKAGDLLEQNGFIELKNIREPHKYLYKRFDRGKEIVAIHLHNRVFWGATFIDPDSAWLRANGRLLDDVVFPLSVEDCLLTTFAHSFYENSAIRLLDLCVVKHLVDSGEVDWPYARDTARGYKWEDGFHLSVIAYARLHDAVFGGPLFPQAILNDARRFTGRRILLRKAVQNLDNAKPAMPFYLPLLTSKLLAYKKILLSSEFGGMHRRILNLAKLLLEVLLVHILKLNPQKGMLVALSGMDGSGKSAHVHALVEAVHACGLNTHYLWTRAGSQRGFLSLTKILSRRSTASSQSGNEGVGVGRFQRTSRLLSARWRLIPWKIVNVVDYCVFYNLMLRVRLLKRQIVVCDRYVPDIFVDLHSYVQERPNRIWLKLLSCFLPRPTLSILLTTPVDIALRRSSDAECMDFIQRQAEVYAQTQELLQLTVVDNGHREFREVCNELTAKVLHQYYGKKCVWFGWEQNR